MAKPAGSSGLLAWAPGSAVPCVQIETEQDWAGPAGALELPCRKSSGGMAWGREAGRKGEVRKRRARRQEVRECRELPLVATEGRGREARAQPARTAHTAAWLRAPTCSFGRCRSGARLLSGWSGHPFLSLLYPAGKPFLSNRRLIQISVCPPHPYLTHLGPGTDRPRSGGRPGPAPTAAAVPPHSPRGPGVGFTPGRKRGERGGWNSPFEAKRRLPQRHLRRR